jgi:hypothetical protein
MRRTYGRPTTSAKQDARCEPEARDVIILAVHAAGHHHLVCGAIAIGACLWTLSVGHAQSPIVLRDVTKATDIRFQHTDGSSGRHYIVEYISAGLALFDYDGDGLIDIYFVNGAPLLGTEVDKAPRNALYRNEGGWRFTDVTEQAGVGDTGHGLGAVVADYDSDGDQDLYVMNFGPNVLYRNNGDGTFTAVTDEAGVGNGNKVGAGACFLDADRDGYLDLYVSNYIKFSYDKHVPTTYRRASVYQSPLEYEPEPDVLYGNNADGSFTDRSAVSGIGRYAGRGMGVVCADYDNDGDTDIFVGNDEMENYLFENDGSGTFAEVALLRGTAYDATGKAQGSMGVDCGDFNNDGWLDFFVTTYQDEPPALYQNSGNGYFEDVTLATHVGVAATPNVNWGIGFVDFDLDGDRDIFMACGHMEDNIKLASDAWDYLAPNILLMNTGDGKFVDVSATSGDGMAVKLSSRGAAFDDLDNDGDIDAVIVNSRREPTILRNESETGNHWLQIRLQGVKTNRDGVGAQVRVVAGDLVQLDEVHSGRGYQSHYGTRLHFGLGKHDRIDRVEVRWIGGGLDVLENVDVDQLLTIIEGSQKPAD